MRRIAGDNGKLLGLERYRPTIGRIEMGDTFQAAEQLVTVGVYVEIGSSILDHAKTHVEAVHLREIDVRPHVDHRIRQGLKLMLPSMVTSLDSVTGVEQLNRRAKKRGFSPLAPH